MAMKEWMKVIPETEKATYKRAGFMGTKDWVQKQH
jgi:hypothetical protein